MILLARLCKIWINVSLLNILNIVTMFVPYTVATCRERGGGGGRNINSETNHCTNQLNIKAHIVSKFTIPKITTFKLIVVT